MLQCTDIKKQPTANIIDGNVQLHILSLIPDNFQGVIKIVFEQFYLIGIFIKLCHLNENYYFLSICLYILI